MQHMTYDAYACVKNNRLYLSYKDYFDKKHMLDEGASNILYPFRMPYSKIRLTAGLMAEHKLENTVSGEPYIVINNTAKPKEIELPDVNLIWDDTVFENAVEDYEKDKKAGDSNAR